MGGDVGGPYGCVCFFAPLFFSPAFLSLFCLLFITLVLGINLIIIKLD